MTDVEAFNSPTFTPKAMHTVLDALLFTFAWDTHKGFDRKRIKGLIRHLERQAELTRPPEGNVIGFRIGAPGTAGHRYAIQQADQLKALSRALTVIARLDQKPRKRKKKA